MIESLERQKTDTEKREREDCYEIGNITRSGRCFKPDNLKTSGDKEKDKEKEKGKHLSPGQIENESSIDQDFGSGSIVSGRR